MTHLDRDDDIYQNNQVDVVEKISPNQHVRNGGDVSSDYYQRPNGWQIPRLG